MDIFTAEKRSKLMSRIKGKNTKIEMKVRKKLYSLGFRYRINVSRLPGKPDIVLSRYRVVIFVHGCFWHGHTNCKDASIPKTRTEWWLDKISKNVHRDKVNIDKLIESGWKVYVIWECEVQKNFDVVIEQLVNKIRASGIH